MENKRRPSQPSISRPAILLPLPAAISAAPRAHGTEADGHNRHRLQNSETHCPQVPHRIGWNEDRLAREQQPLISPMRNAELGQYPKARREMNSRYVHEPRIAQNEIPLSFQHEAQRTGIPTARTRFTPFIVYPVYCAEYPTGVWNNEQRGFEAASYVTQVPGPLNPTSSFPGNYMGNFPYRETQRCGPSTASSITIQGNGSSHLNRRAISERNHNLRQANVTN